MFKMKEDPRITRVGKFFDERYLDELMQVFNVLKGDMTLVGPRPPPQGSKILYGLPKAETACYPRNNLHMADS